MRGWIGKSGRVGNIRVALAVALAASLPTASFAQRSNEQDFQAGRDAWLEKKWQKASFHLARYWVVGRDTASYEVDFWLGTSWCRLQGQEHPGADLLDWAFHFRQMPELARPVFRSELGRCLKWISDGASIRDDPAGLLAAANGTPVATVRASGKTYSVGGDRGGLAAYPVRVKQPVKLEELEKRLTPRTNPARAMEKTKLLAPGFRLHQSKYFVLASLSPGHDSQALRAIGDRLDDYVVFLGRTFELAPPDTFITVFMVPDIKTLQKWADQLHGLDASDATLGYAFENDMSVVAMLSTTAAGTLLHEVFHVLVRGSYASIPQWLDEGIASLYETSTVSGGYYFGEPNWRSPVFQDHLAAYGHTIRLADVITSPWFSDQPSTHARVGERPLSPGEQAYILAYARMFMLYLQETRTLLPVFKAFRYREPPAIYVPAKTQAIKLLERTLNRPIGEIEADVLRFAPSVYDPNRRIYTGRPVPKELPAFIARELPKTGSRPTSAVTQSIDRQ